MTEEDVKEIYYCFKYSLNIPKDLKIKLYNILTKKYPHLKWE
jgi:hypothetical protein